HLRSLGVLFFLGDSRLGLPLCIRVGHRAIGFCTARQVRRRDFAGARTIKFGDQRSARIGLDGGNRSRTRPHSEAMEGKYGFSLCGTAHGTAPEDAKLQGGNRDRLFQLAKFATSCSATSCSI